MPNMKSVLLAVVLLSQLASASMRALTPYEQMTTCYPSSPMLMSDACYGQVYMGGVPSSANYNGLQNSQFSDLYALMNALQGNNLGSSDPFAGMNMSSPMLWQEQSLFPKDIYSMSPLSAVK